MALSGDRPGKGHVAQGTSNTTAYVPHILQHKPPTGQSINCPLTSYNQPKALGVVVGASRHPNAFG